MPIPEQVQGLVQVFEERVADFELFRDGVARFFSTHPRVAAYVHSIKSRTKSVQSFRSKIIRKWDDANPLTGENLFFRFTDLAGVRVLHLHQAQFKPIHEAIHWKVGEGDWIFAENPKAYTWDPESVKFFGSLGLEVEAKESFYTSIHYLVRPRVDSPMCCEIQVRTLFEEIWGEVDHSMNYPNPVDNKACKEQLLVLAKLVGAGSRLVDSIYRVLGDPAVNQHQPNQPL